MPEASELSQQRRHCTALRYSAEPDADAQLIVYAGSADAGVRTLAILMLGGRQTPEALELIIHTLRTDTAEDPRTTSAIALGRYDAPRARQALIDAIPDAPDCVIGSIAGAISQHPDAEAVATIRPLLSAKLWFQRLLVCGSLLQCDYYGDDLLATLQELATLPECIEWDTMMAQAERDANAFLAEQFPGEKPTAEAHKSIADMIQEVLDHEAKVTQ